jgi:hypothetical protein
MLGWMLSQFLHGEQGALLATAQIVNTVPDTEAKFLPPRARSRNEARHVEVYRRYLTEKLPVAFPCESSPPHAPPGRIIREPRWEHDVSRHADHGPRALALAAFGIMNLMNPHEHLLRQITGYVIRDEARHVAFGVLALQGLYREMTAAELREREEFVIEAAVLMRDRLLMAEVWERLGYDVGVWVRWMTETPFMQAYRQLLFAKIVPNLKRLGCSRRGVREAFARDGRPPVRGSARFDRRGDGGRSACSSGPFRVPDRRIGGVGGTGPEEMVDSGPASVVKSIFNIAWPWTPAPAAPPPSSA